MSPRAAQYQPQEKREPMHTEGVFTDWIGAHEKVVAHGEDAIYEPSPLAGGPAKECAGFGNTGLNIILHLVAAVLTIVAGAIHVQAGDDSKHLTQNLNDTDWISVWCWIMILGTPLAVLLWVIWFGCVRRSFQTPFVANIGGTIFLLVFVCTIKLSYFLEISHYLANNAGGDHQNSDMNHAKNEDPEGLTFAALLFQCYILITSIYTPMSGTYYKVLQAKDELAKSSYQTWGGRAYDSARAWAASRPKP